MYRQWIGLEHLGLHPNPTVNTLFGAEVKINGVGPFTLKRSTDISDAIRVESPAWFEVVSVQSDGRKITVRGILEDDPV